MAAVTAAVIGAGTAIYASSQAKKQQKDAQKFAKEQMGALDPFAEYRPESAARLNALSKDPSSIKDSASYKARLLGAERAMAAQGYTGSGNALVAAADAGAAAYQQEFDNLAMMAGVSSGQGARSSAYGTAAGANSNANDNYLSGIAGVGNNLTNLASMFNKPVNTGGNYATSTLGSGMTYTAPATSGGSSWMNGYGGGI